MSETPTPLEQPTPALLVTLALHARAGDVAAANALVVEAGYGPHPIYVFANMVQLAKYLGAYQGGTVMVQAAPDATELETLVMDCASAVLADEHPRLQALINDALEGAGVLQREAFIGALLSFGAELLLGSYLHTLPDTILG